MKHYANAVGIVLSSTLPSIVLPIALLSAAPKAHADWTGQGEVGFVMARGNSESDTANAKLDLTNELERWKHAFGTAALYGKSNEIESARRWDARWQSDYKLNERAFVFGAARYESDRFSGFEYRGTLSTGLGYHFIDTPDTQLIGSLGAGYRLSRQETLTREVGTNAVTLRTPGDKSDEVIGSAGVNFEHALTPNTKVTDKMLVEYGATNTSAQNELALQVSMTEKLALSVGYGVRHNTDPPAGSEKTDQLTTLNLVYKIK